MISNKSKIISYILNLLILVFTFFLLVYVYPPSPEFPKPPSDFVQSFEPADVETPPRRGYYTNMSRQQVIEHYEKEFNLGFIYTPRLNYPPEEAQTIIRDQTKSTFLEEIVHPLRESLYVNGFEPKEEQYAQYYEGTRYNQKIIVRYVPSQLIERISIVLLISVCLFLFKMLIVNKK